MDQKERFHTLFMFFECSIPVPVKPDICALSPGFQTGIHKQVVCKGNVFGQRAEVPGSNP